MKDTRKKKAESVQSTAIPIRQNHRNTPIIRFHGKRGPKPTMKTKFNQSEEPIWNECSAFFAMRQGGKGKSRP
jgi:hypothetical protein